MTYLLENKIHLKESVAKAHREAEQEEEVDPEPVDEVRLYEDGWKVRYMPLFMFGYCIVVMNLLRSIAKITCELVYA